MCRDLQGEILTDSGSVPCTDDELLNMIIHIVNLYIILFPFDLFFQCSRTVFYFSSTLCPLSPLALSTSSHLFGAWCDDVKRRPDMVTASSGAPGAMTRPTKLLRGLPL